MTTPNYFGWTDDKAEERFALQREMNNAIIWAAEQTLANERASAEYVKHMDDHAEWIDNIATQEDARY